MTDVLVSCIMPTHNRRPFVAQAIGYFARQDYPHRELLIVDDGTDAIQDLVPEHPHIRYLRLDRTRSLSAKRNLACQEAHGEIIVHWDDDDWMAPWRLSYQVNSLLQTQVELCGLDRLLFYEPGAERAWQYVYPPGERPWLAGGTLCYVKTFWRRHPFPDLNVGEDTRFVWSSPTTRLLPLDQTHFYVALIHRGNTSPKHTAGQRWRAHSVAAMQQLMGEDHMFYAQLLQPLQSAAQPAVPLVSCMLPTYNRRHFLPQAIRYFQRQDYPHRELIVVDDGTDAVGDLIPPGSNIQYIRLPNKHSLGAKRNIACEAARGEIIISWDDDDWYAPHRIAYQVEPLLQGRAEVTSLGRGLLLSVPTHEFWMTTEQLHARMFAQGAISGTMAFWKRLWSRGVRFPPRSLAEDATFLQALRRAGARLVTLQNRDTFIYVRHASNTWQFTPGNFLDRRGWRRVEPPSFVSQDDLAFYGVYRHDNGAHQPVVPCEQPHTRIPHQPPLVSCILATTAQHRCFLRQAVTYFLRQTYANKELLIVDDGPRLDANLVPQDERIRYLHLDAPTPLGTKLNLGIAAAHGQIIQKLDDDDYYHPDFLRTTVGALLGHAPERSIVGFDSFVVLIVATGEVKWSGSGWCAGGTLCFYRQLWERKAFRDVPRAVDWFFLQDHAAQRLTVRNPEQYILVRHHAGHLWTTMHTRDVTDFFRRQPPYTKSLTQLMPLEDVQFYERLRQHSARPAML